MENFTFHDIFATKNIDYLLAIVSLLILIPLWKVLRAGLYPASEAKNSDTGSRNMKPPE